MSCRPYPPLTPGLYSRTDTITVPPVPGSKGGGDGDGDEGGGGGARSLRREPAAGAAVSGPAAGAYTEHYSAQHKHILWDTLGA
jgi:hypothetical protein